MECHPEEDDDSEHETESNNARTSVGGRECLTGILLCSTLGSCLLPSFYMTEGVAGGIIDKDREDE